MIEKTEAYRTSDDQPFYDLDTAQQHEIELILKATGEPKVASLHAKAIVEKAAQIVEILTTTGKPARRRRKSNKPTTPAP